MSIMSCCKLYCRLLISFFLLCGVSGFNETHRTFPEGFIFGVATAAYQIEGAWNVADKGENIWDRLVHTTELVENGDTGDVACDSYNKYERDVEMLLELGVDFYRFSLSWSRILPTGFDNKISEDGIAYYNKLINLLLAKGITPYVTIYHWDLPQTLQNIGGWANPLMENYLEDYSRVCFEAFGDRIKNWITLNEPSITCMGYSSQDLAPALNFNGIGDYLCAHHMLKAHARVYHLYDKKYRAEQKGRISLDLYGGWHEPTDLQNPEDLLASELGMQFEIGWLANPIYSERGDYPDIMKEYVKSKSVQQGYSTSRLPEFTLEEVEYIKGTFDFFGLNHYSSSMVRLYEDGDERLEHSFAEDRNIYRYKKSEWPVMESRPWFTVVPWGITKVLHWVKERYNNPEVIIFENGYTDFGGTSDSGRTNYYLQYVNAILDAIDDGCNITGYTAWSLMDNFEWMDGYSPRFGLYEVDFESPERTRTIRDSGKFYAEITRTRFIQRDN